MTSPPCFPRMGESPISVRVLLADDSIEFRRLLRILLGRDGRFEVVAEAGDGVAAVEMTKEHRPDVVLLDVAMPKMDGLQALPSIREIAPATKVVMLSAFSATEMAEKAHNQGADAYLEKGELFERMAETIIRVCDG